SRRGPNIIGFSVWSCRGPPDPGDHARIICHPVSRHWDGGALVRTRDADLVHLHRRAWNLLDRPGVLRAISPSYAAALLGVDPLRAFLTLGTVVLTVTGAEALYADMGHFGRRPIARAWIGMVLPALLLCYAGQAALLLENPAAVEQVFFL